MKIYVACGFNDRDKWILSLVPRLIKAFDSEPITGRDMEGEVITDADRKRIEEADALLAFFTRRGDKQPDGTWNTHLWVRDELVHALANDKRVLPIYEDGVTREPGISGRDRQYMPYCEEARLDFMVSLAEVLGRWHRSGKRRFQILPNEALLPHLGKGYFKCSYRVMEGYSESAPYEVPVRRITGGLFIDAEVNARNSLIQVQIQTDAGALISDYTPVDAVAIKLPDETP
jgi:hypothetical protein